MLKRLVTILLMSFVSMSIVSAKGAISSTEQAADEMMKAYENVMKSGDMVKTLDFIYPKLFDISSKEQMKAMFEQSKSAAPEIISYSYSIKKPIKQYKDGFYTIALYNSVSKVDMSKTMPKEMKKEFNNPQKVKEFQEMMQKMAGNGNAKITFDEKNPFQMTMEQKNGKILLINENNSGWKMLDLSNKMGAMMASAIIPKDILKDKSIMDLK